MKTSINAKLAEILNDVDKNKLKDSKEKVATLEPVISAFKSDTLKVNLEALSVTRTKKAFKETLATIIKDLKEVQTRPTTDTKKDTKKDAPVLDQEKLDELASSIKENLENAQKSFLAVGKLLTQGLTMIKEAGKTQKDFLAWADASCHIKKAQVYKLMKVYKEFGEDSDFAGTSMRVLYTLSGQSKEVVEEAATLAKAGKLDTAALDKLIMKETSKPTDKKDSLKGTPAKTGDSTNKNESTSKNESKVDQELLEENKRLQTELELLKKADKSKTKDKEGADVSESQTIKELQATIDSLNKTIEELQTSLAEQREARKDPIVKVPALPQFDSPCKATCIGLELENVNDKVKINKAYRALAKIYTATTCPEAARKLKIARDELIAEIK